VSPPSPNTEVVVVVVVVVIMSSLVIFTMFSILDVSFTSLCCSLIATICSFSTTQHNQYRNKNWDGKEKEIVGQICALTKSKSMTDHDVENAEATGSAMCYFVSLAHKQNLGPYRLRSSSIEQMQHNLFNMFTHYAILDIFTD
jgi:hypothetical protein